MIQLRLSVLVLCFTSAFLLTVWGYSIPWKRNGRGVPLASFKLTKITQRRIETGYTVQLHVQGPIMPRVFSYPRDKTSLEPVQMASQGVFQFNAIRGIYKVICLHPRGYQILRVNVVGENYSEQLVPSVDFALHGVQGKNITFQRGNNVNVNVTLTVGTHNHTHSEFVNGGSFFMKSPSADHAVSRYRPAPSDSPFAVEDKGGSENEKYANLLIKTASGEVKGLLGLDVHLYWYRQQMYLLDSYIIHEDVPVYPSDDDDGPFTRNFIGLLTRHREENEKICSVHDAFPCILSCEFIGDHPTEVEFIRVDQPTLGIPEERMMSLSNSGFRAEGHIFFWNITTDDEGTYQCKSRSGSVEVGKNFTVIVIHEARISHALSNATIVNGAVEVTCVAEGTPAPTLTFRGIPSNTTFDDNNMESYQIFRTQLDDKTSKAVLRITDTAMVANMTSIECTAENESHGRHFSRSKSFSLSDVDNDNRGDMSASVRYFLENFVVDTGSD